MSCRTAFYYDNRRNLTCVLDPDNGLTYYTYDALNRMTSVRNPLGETTHYEYSPGGRPLVRVLGNGTLAYYSYDAVGQVAKVDNRKSDLSVISSFGYQRDALGSPLSILREDNSVIYYGYDAKEQLVAETQCDSQGQQVYAWTWGYDPAGNRLQQTYNGATTTYEYNAANELTQETVGGATTYYSYDHCGNTTLRAESAGVTYYHWDFENLMTQIDLPGNAHSYFSYDADSKRVEKRDSGGYTRFIYQGPDMLKLLQERDASNSLQAQYTMGNGLEAMRRGSTSSFYHYDGLGSTFELTDGTATVTDTYHYNAWGEVLSQAGTTNNPHVYAGRVRYYFDTSSGMYVLGLRQYRCGLGRFLTQDPLGPRQHFLYSANRPVLAVDPTGEFAKGVLYFTFGDVDPGFAAQKMHGAARTWRDISGGTFVLNPVSYATNAPGKMCVTRGGAKRTVDLGERYGDWVRRTTLGGVMNAMIALAVWGYIETTYGITPQPAAPVTQRTPRPLPGPQRASVAWIKSGPTGEYGYSPNGGGRVLMVENAVKQSADHGGGIVAHELGHGIFGLQHAWCGLMHGIMDSSWCDGCVDCAEWQNPDNVRTLGEFGVAVPAQNQCQVNWRRWWNSAKACQPVEGGVTGYNVPYTDPGDIVFQYGGPCQ